MRVCVCARVCNNNLQSVGQLAKRSFISRTRVERGPNRMVHAPILYSCQVRDLCEETFISLIYLYMNILLE